MPTRRAQAYGSDPPAVAPATHRSTHTGPIHRTAFHTRRRARG